MVTVTGRSSSSTTGGPSSTIRPTPSSDGDVFNNTSTPFDNLNLDNLRLNSSTPSTAPDIYSANTRPGSHLTPETEIPPASQPSTPGRSVRVLTPGTSSAPSVVGTEQPTSSNSSSSSVLPPGLTIDFSLSISTHGSPSRSPFQFTGADCPLPSVEDSSTPERSSPARQPTGSSGGNRSHASTPTRRSVAIPPQVRDRVGSITSQVRQIRIADDSRSSPADDEAQPEPTPPRFLTPHQDDNDIGRGDGSPSPSQPSGGRRRRSSSQMNQTPHNVRDEEPPEDDFNSPAFQRSFMNTRELMARLETTLGSSNLHNTPDSTIQRLRQKAGELARFHCPPTRTVGFVGDSGVGKSSLLNSLLDCEGLARASNGGAACTCVVTEYHYHEHNNFRIAIDFFTMDELKTQITEMVRAYRRQHLGPPTTDKEEQKDIADRAQVASHTFQAMFRGQNEFAEGRFVLSNESEEIVTTTMLLWAEEVLYDSEGIAEGMTVNTEGDCSRVLAQFTSERFNSQETNATDADGGERSLWPFIKKIRVHVNAHILSKGLILVDLPGLRDLNSARQNITERYILECDEIFAVRWIGRAVTDVGVKAVFDLARQARLSNVGIVFTKSDEINPNEALTDWEGPEGSELEGRMVRLKTAEDELKGIKARVTELREFQLDDDLSDGEKAELERLSFQVYSKEKTIETLKFEQDRYLITVRNEIVKTELENLYKDTIPGGNLKVFCVSNKLYWKHRKSAKDKALQWLELSGVIGLRKHCVAMVSDSQLRIATNYMKHDVRSLVSSVELWIQSGARTETAERKALVRETLDIIENRLKRDLSGRHSSFARIARTFVEEFREQIYSAQHITRWTRGAREASNVWAGWHQSTYSAFCRYYGRYDKGVQGPQRDWNREAMEAMVRDMRPLWDVFERSMGGERTSRMLISVHEVMDWASEYLANQLSEEDVSGEILHQSLESREGLLANDLENVFLAFEDQLSQLGKDFLESYKTSLMGRGMEGAYNRCSAQSGTNCTVRKKAIISRTLSDGDLFRNIIRTLYNRFKDLATELQNAVKTTVERHLAAIGETMDILRDENIIAESERDSEFRRRVEEEVARVRGQLPARATRELRG